MKGTRLWKKRGKHHSNEQQEKKGGGMNERDVLACSVT